ncbi:hypothetical protein [Thermococcus peptonophilus]|uniref:hypothetical protein n=1 Tax=Thermococcus peptonophilus TaxID=53952 RepID=UPI003465FFA7
MVGIIGPSGSGKSTLVLTFNGIIPHSIRGRVFGGSACQRSLNGGGIEDSGDPPGFQTLHHCWSCATEPPRKSAVQHDG